MTCHVLPLGVRLPSGAAMRLRLDRRDDQDVFALVLESTLPEQADNPDARATTRHSIIHLDEASADWLRSAITEVLGDAPDPRRDPDDE